MRAVILPDDTLVGCIPGGTPVGCIPADSTPAGFDTPGTEQLAAAVADCCILDSQQFQAQRCRRTHHRLQEALGCAPGFKLGVFMVARYHTVSSADY